MSALSDSIATALNQLPFKVYHPEKITDTLQGSIWRASTTKNVSKNTHKIVIKLTNRKQHKKCISVVKNVVYRDIKENIVSETSILKYLSDKKAECSFITKYISFLKTDEFYILMQEDGGYSLFDFAKTAHTLIRRGKINISHWKKVVRAIFKKLIESIAYIHRQNVCHNDVSLENFLINDVPIEVDEDAKIIFKLKDIQIKLCDFGLAELHSNAECISNKHCGKQNYKSPEVIQLKREFNAKKNDIWGIGVCLFMLAFGCSPFDAAHDASDTFRCMMDGHICNVLKIWNLLMYIDPYAIDLFNSIFKLEANRISMNQMENHPFVNLQSN